MTPFSIRIPPEALEAIEHYLGAQQEATANAHGPQAGGRIS